MTEVRKERRDKEAGGGEGEKGKGVLSTEATMGRRSQIGKRMGKRGEEEDLGGGLGGHPKRKRLREAGRILSGVKGGWTQKGRGGERREDAVKKKEKKRKKKGASSLFFPSIIHSLAHCALGGNIGRTYTKGTLHYTSPHYTTLLYSTLPARGR